MSRRAARALRPARLCVTEIEVWARAPVVQLAGYECALGPFASFGPLAVFIFAIPRLATVVSPRSS
jgi:hypothetical protein